jgi:hypothetical protein
MMQGAWSVVVRRHPTIEKGDWVANYDGSTTKQARKDVKWAGRGRVLDAGPDTRVPNYVTSNPGEDTYLVIGVDNDSSKIKITTSILMDEEDMHLTEQYSPKFIKRNYNSKLYKAQLFRTCKNTIKVNAWVRDYNVNLTRVRREHLNTFAHSNVKGFMWLFCSHALPVGTRMRGKNANSKCPHCHEEEDVFHMAFDCTMARYIRKTVFKEWWSRTGDHRWARPHKFEEALFFKGSETLEVAKHTLNDITTYHIWKYRCNILYDGDEKVTLATVSPRLQPK